MSALSDTAGIKQMLKDRIDDLCLRLLPDGRRQGRLWVAHNPVTQDFRQSPEFKVALGGDVGAWRCWRSGEKGDVFSLIAYCAGCRDFREVIGWAKDFLGLRFLAPEARAAMTETARANAVRARIAAEKAVQHRIARAGAIFGSGRPYGEGGAAERHGLAYLAGRGCDPRGIASLDLATFRFHPGLEYWKRAEFRHQDGRRVKIRSGPLLPAVLSAMRGPTGLLTAIHITFLDPLEPRKFAAEGREESARLMFGEARGAMIRIAHGPEAKPPEEAFEPHPLILCEGVEDGLSLALACPQARIWAAGSLAAMAAAPVDLAAISAVILARDNDWSKRQAVEQFEAARAALCATGKPVTEMASSFGKDFNDLLQGGEDVFSGGRA